MWGKYSPAERAGGAVFWIVVGVGLAVWLILYLAGEPVIGAGIAVGAFVLGIALFMFVSNAVDK